MPTNSNKKISNIIKRLLDVIIAVLVFVLFLPIIFLSAILIFIFEGRPIFYVSTRVISKIKSIRIFKFRTMVKNATSPHYKLNERFMRNGFLDIPLDCKIYTPIGRFLERTQIVEILQTLNIIKGDMSFVGNRPLPSNNIEFLKKFDGWEERFNSPSGITGISQIAGKYSLQAHERIQLERMYSSIFSGSSGNILLCDFLIIWHTGLLILTGKYLGHERSVALLIACGADERLKNTLETENS